MKGLLGCCGIPSPPGYLDSIGFHTVLGHSDNIKTSSPAVIYSIFIASVLVAVTLMCVKTDRLDMAASLMFHLVDVAYLRGEQTQKHNHKALLSISRRETSKHNHKHTC